MTDTPETDANDDAWAYNMKYNTFNSLMDTPLEWDEFSRKLERERDEARMTVESLTTTSFEILAALGKARDERDRLVVALRECLEDSMELKAEHDWWSHEPRCGRQVKYQRQKRYQETLNNIKRANETLQSLNSSIDTDPEKK